MDRKNIPDDGFEARPEEAFDKPAETPLPKSGPGRAADGTISGGDIAAPESGGCEPVEESLRKSKERYQTLFDSIDEGFCVIELIYDHKGRVVDWVYQETNPAFIRHTGLKDPVGRRIRELQPDFEEKWFDIIAAIAVTGKPSRFVEHSRALNRWLEVYAFRVGGATAKTISLLVSDITERRQMEESLRASEERFRMLVLASSEVLYRMSPDWRELRQLHSTGFLANLESPSSDWVHDYIHPDDQSMVQAVIEEAIRSKRVFELEHRVRREDGSVGWTYSRAVPLMDAQGEITEWFGAASDITKRKRAEEKWRHALTTSAALIRISEVLHATLDFDEIMQRIVAEGSTLLGSESAAVSLLQGGRWVVSHVHDIPPNHIEETLKCGYAALALESHQPVAVDDAINDAHMHCHHSRSVLVAPLIIRNEAVGVMFFNYHTVQHRFTSPEIDFVRQMANIAGIALSNAQLYKELEERHQQLNEYGYALTHNLKAPLRAIQNYTNFLFEDLAPTLEGEPRKFLAGIRSAARQGHAKVTDLEMLYRIDNHALSVEAFALQELFDEMRSIFQESPDRELVVAQNCPRLWAERFLLRQILIELIRNGFKFNRAETKRVEIGWQPSADHTGVEISVRDNGIGIAPEYHEQIFRIFQRLHTLSEYEGTGIGLAIAKRAVQKLGGILHVESVVDEGSLFRVSLPNAIVHNDPP